MEFMVGGHSTSNIQNPTSSDLHLGHHWMLDVGCSMLDVQFRSSSPDRPPLIQRQQPPPARRADVLVMHAALRRGEAVIEAELIQHDLEIIHVHPARVTPAATPAMRPRSRGAGF